MIRAAAVSDLPQIKVLWNAVIRDTAATFTSVEKTDADMADLLASREDAFLVAHSASQCAGFITWGPFRAGPGYAHKVEHTIITASGGIGTGRALMEAAIKHARAHGIHVMVAAISGGNSAAIDFHDRLGFAKTGHLPQVGRKMGQWHDLILMSRNITAP